MTSERNGDSVILINTFSVPPGREEEFLERWNRHADVVVGQPGYQGTRLHRNLNPDGTHTFVNVARWESQELFRRAISQPEFRALGRLSEFASEPGLFRVVVER